MLLWNIWLSRNRKIFNDKEPSIRKVCSKAWSLTLETIASKINRKIDINEILVEERSFLRNLLDRTSIHKATSIQPLWKATSWKIWLKYKYFTVWTGSCARPTLFFYGASKSNLGIAGVGGIIINENGKSLISYEWGLGSPSNDKMEAYALLQGLHQLKKLNISNEMVFGDSSIIINMMNHDHPIRNIDLHRIISRCRSISKYMEGITFYHILWRNNKDTYSLANKACA